MTIDVAVCTGTYNRLAVLQKSIESVRRSVGKLSYVCLLADGGSTDGTREWIVEQPDCELLEGGLNGSVTAFNMCYSRAMDLQSPWIVTWNDEINFIGPKPEIECSVDIMKAAPVVGVVGWPSDRYGNGFAFERAFICYTYPTQCIIRREAGMSIARAQGDPEGKAIWDRRYHSYGADTSFSMWMYRLGWGFHEAHDLCVHDPFCTDGALLEPMRKRNAEQNTTSDLFYQMWPNAASFAYNRADAEKYGGVLR
jgi:glycosyltransferase involved in cell wall biosynthesis